jgi:hypothetical protein
MALFLNQFARRFFTGVAVANTTAATNIINFDTTDNAAAFGTVLYPKNELDINLYGTITTNATPGNAVFTVAFGGVNVASTGNVVLTASQSAAYFALAFKGIAYTNAATGNAAMRSIMTLSGANGAVAPVDVQQAGLFSGPITVTATLTTGSSTNFITINQGLVDFF